MDLEEDPDVQVEVEDDEGTEMHPKILANAAPVFFIQYYQTAIGFLQSYGWYLVLACIILFIIKRRLEPYFRRMSQQMRQQRELHVDPDVAERRMGAMDAHRQRLQEEFDAKAARFAEELKKKEDEKRKAKIEDWERHRMGEGYRSRTKPGEDQGTSAGTQRPTARPTRGPNARVYRPSDYNPLTGTSGSDTSYRPPRRGGSGGGG